MIDVKKNIAKQWLVFFAVGVVSLAYGGAQLCLQHNAQTLLNKIELADESNEEFEFIGEVQRAAQSEIVSIESLNDNSPRFILRLENGRYAEIADGDNRKLIKSKLGRYIALKQTARLDARRNAFICFLVVYICAQVILTTRWAVNVIRYKTPGTASPSYKTPDTASPVATQKTASWMSPFLADLKR